MSDYPTILIAIQPKYADLIFEGLKKVELRRVKPKRIGDGSIVLLYVSSPIKSIAGGFRVKNIIEEPINKLWKKVYNLAGISRKDFEKYYCGNSKGVGIFIENTWKYSKPFSLVELRKNLNNFIPPQSFRYATQEETSYIGV
ncbi:ASCH domain protein [Candidatus Magnetomorum sp. HK-1]|nr:ASCH domain protein [Candidatus Magnetomorum sp. HK-1]